MTYHRLVFKEEILPGQIVEIHVQGEIDTNVLNTIESFVQHQL